MFRYYVPWITYAADLVIGQIDASSVLANHGHFVAHVVLLGLGRKSIIAGRGGVVALAKTPERFRAFDWTSLARIAPTLPECTTAHFLRHLHRRDGVLRIS